MKRRFVMSGLIIGAACFFLTTSLFAQVEIPRGKSSTKMVKEARTYISGISAQETKRLMDSNPDVVLLDIRSIGEEKEQGWIKGRMKLAYGRMIFNIRERVPNKNVPIVVYCKKGKRSSVAGYDLIQMGYSNVKYMDGGMLGWRNEGLPYLTSSNAGKIDLPMGKTPEDFLREARAIAGSGISPVEAKRRLDTDPNTYVLHITTRRERTLGGQTVGGRHILMEMGMVPFNIQKKIHGANEPIIIICGEGKRATILAKTLKEMGYKNVAYIAGGITAWKKAGLPVTAYVAE